MYSYKLASGVTVSTIIQVQQELIARDNHILRLDNKSGGVGVPDNNLVCFDNSGNVLWTVEPCFPLIGSENPYMDIFLLQDGNLGASTWRDINVIIDISNGKILKATRASLI